MKANGKIAHENPTNLIDDFITSQVISRGLDPRTEKAYRIDLEHFYDWIKYEEEGRCNKRSSSNPDGQSLKTADKVIRWEEKIDQYVHYLSQEKGLRSSTISRKYRVVGYFLQYLACQGFLSENDMKKTLKVGGQNWIKKERFSEQTLEESVQETAWAKNCLSKQEVESFFRAFKREYEELDSDFRKRICLRDRVMMELLFYHGIEISELLRIEVSDYNPKTSILRIYRKRGKNRFVYLFSKALQEQMTQWLNGHSYFEHEEEFRNYMFLSKLGKPISMKMVINVFDKYRILAGIKKECTPKDLKNSLRRYAEEMVREKG